MKFTIHYTDNAACANRGAGGDSIDDYVFEGTLTEVLNFGAYTMNISVFQLDEDQWREDVEAGEWENTDDQSAINSMDEADLGAGSPVIFWIEDETGHRVYDSGLDEADWSGDDEDEDEDEEEEEDFEVDDD